jgi:hypothetical protein
MALFRWLLWGIHRKSSEDRFWPTLPIRVAGPLTGRSRPSRDIAVAPKQTSRIEKADFEPATSFPGSGSRAACIERVLHFATALSCRLPPRARNARFAISFVQWSVYLQPPNDS